MTHHSETSGQELVTDEGEERREAAEKRAPVVIGAILGLALAPLFHMALRVFGITMSTRSETEIRLVLVGLIGPMTVYGFIVARPDWLDKGSGDRADKSRPPA